MASSRLKHSFTSGELSPLMEARHDFERHKNGCKRLYNMIALTQGPATRRPGTKFVIDLSQLMENLYLITAPIVKLRLVEFVRSQVESFMLAFMELDNGDKYIFYFQNHQIAFIPPAYTVVMRTTLSADWDIDNFDYAQSIDEMYFSQRNVPPMKLVYSGGVFTLSAIVFNPVNGPVDSGTASSYWSAVNGWPERVTFHQQRLVFAANTLYRDHIWMSESGSYFTFLGGVDDNNSVAFSLASGAYNRIQWISSGKSLHVGTVGDEWTVTGSTSQAITPKSKVAMRQTKIGSEPLQPIQVDSATLFLSRGARNIAEFIYDYSYDSYRTSDLSVLSTHVTDMYPIVDWAYQQVPNKTLWCVRSDGALLGMTYQREHKITGWHGHATQGLFKSVAAIPGGTREDDVWVAVTREVDGVQRWYIEVLEDMFIGGYAEDGRFLDSFLLYRVQPSPLTHELPPAPPTPDYFYPLSPSRGDGENDYDPSTYCGTVQPPFSTPFGYPDPIDVTEGVDGAVTFIYLGHLEGKMVDIIIAGAVYPPQVVVGGSVTVNIPVGIYPDTVRAVVGLRYVSEVRPLVPESPTREGTSRGKMQRISEFEIDFFRTLGAKIGVINSETGEIKVDELPFRNPADIMGNAVPLFTGIYRIENPGGWSRIPDFFIQQDQPLPLTVRGITDISGGMQ